MCWRIYAFTLAANADQEQDGNDPSQGKAARLQKQRAGSEPKAQAPADKPGNLDAISGHPHDQSTKDD